MRRVIILLYWLFRNKNNVRFSELIKFLAKPRVGAIGQSFIEEIQDDGEFRVVKFTGVKTKLWWPKQYSLAGLYQVTAETFDADDWHYYQKEFTKVNAHDVVLDVGAAEGLFALSVAEKCKKIILIEPNDIFHEGLLFTFKPYRDKVTIHNVAVGDQDGEIVFNNASLSSSVHQDGRGTAKRICKIDTLLPASEAITYFKADIEGFELNMLKGAAHTIARHKPKLVLTTYHRENNVDEIIAFVKSIVPEYKYFVKGIFPDHGKPVMVHFYIG